MAFSTTKDQRENFYNFMNRSFNELSSRIGKVETDVLALKRTVDMTRRFGAEPIIKFSFDRTRRLKDRDSRKLGYDAFLFNVPFDDASHYKNVLAQYFRPRSLMRRKSADIEMAFARNLYLPLASASLIMSILLIPLVLAFTQSFLYTLPFVLSTAFSTYYFWNQRQFVHR